MLETLKRYVFSNPDDFRTLPQSLLSLTLWWRTWAMFGIIFAGALVVEHVTTTKLMAFLVGMLCSQFIMVAIYND